MSKDVFDLDHIALQIAERIRDKATEQGRIPFLTGDLRKSIQVDSLGKGKAAVGSNLNYARAVHDGRPAITIKAKNKKTLKFKGKNGKYVFPREVHQPAREGKPFLKEGFDEVRAEGFGFLDPYLEERASAELADLLKGEINVNLKF